MTILRRALCLINLLFILNGPWVGGNINVIGNGDGLNDSDATFKAYRSLYTAWVDIIARVVMGTVVSRRVNILNKNSISHTQQEPEQPLCRFNTVFKNIGCSFLRSDCHRRGDGTGYICKPSYEPGCSCGSASQRRDWKHAFLPPLYMCESKLISTQQLSQYVFPTPSDKTPMSALNPEQQIEALHSHFGSSISKQELKDLFLIRPESWDLVSPRALPLDIFDLLSLRKDSSKPNQCNIQSFSIDIPLGHCVMNPFFFFGFFILLTLVIAAAIKVLSLYRRYTYEKESLKPLIKIQ